MRKFLSLLLMPTGLGVASLLRVPRPAEGHETVGDQIEFQPPSHEENFVDRTTRRTEVLDKPYTPDKALEVVRGTSLLDVFDRRDQACTSTQQSLSIILRTDNYGYETSWTLKKDGSQIVASGPRQGQNYADNTDYVGVLCVDSGSYEFSVFDKAADGLCCTFGEGLYRVSLDGTTIIESSDEEFQEKNYPFQVLPGSARSGVSAGTVKVEMKIDQYEKETSWEIVSLGSGNVAYTHPPNVLSHQTSVKSVDLAAGDYIITFKDFDGICCRYGEGYFKIYIDNNLLITGGKFQSEVSYKIKVGYDWESLMNDRDRDYLVAHNTRRLDWHSRYNKPYVPLKYSTGLAANAKRYADILLDSCEETGIKHEEGVEEGENLAKNKGTGSWGQLYEAEKIVKRWVDNEEFWGWNRNAHLTQALWRPTQYLGCGESVKTMPNGGLCRLQVCRYAKAGNCEMGKYNAEIGNNWVTPMVADESPCGPICPEEGCFI